MEPAIQHAGALKSSTAAECNTELLDWAFAFVSFSWRICWPEVGQLSNEVVVGVFAILENERLENCSAKLMFAEVINLKW